MARTYSSYSLDAANSDYTTAAGALVSNSGTLIVTPGSSAEAIALAPPVKGCKKRIVYQSDTTTVGLTVRPASSSGGSIVFSNGAAEGASMVIGTTSTSYCVVELVGVSSVQWVITANSPSTLAVSLTTY